MSTVAPSSAVVLLFQAMFLFYSNRHRSQKNIAISVIDI